MRLLRLNDSGELRLNEFMDGKIPCYAILSHTWGADEEEVTFEDISNGTGTEKAGYAKIRFCGEQAARDGLQYFWVDTCCIRKSSDAELTEAINSMFRWYQLSAKCYALLSDVSVINVDGEGERSRRWKPAFKKSRWFTRGWTLQELLAPKWMGFFSEEGHFLGDKQSLGQTVHEITGIAVPALHGRPLSCFSVKERMSWAATRQTKRGEDKAYSLLGIFDIHMPLIYGERQENAMNRLQKEINGTLKGNETPLHEAQRQALLDSLKFDQIDARQMTIRNAHSKTCKWLFKKPEYIDWLDVTKMDEHHGFFWIKGKPGAGKSTLMKFALINAHKTMRDKIVISFFFNARGEDLEKSTLGTYRSLLLQLLERLPALQNIFESLGFSMSSTGTNQRWSTETLEMLLEQAISSLGDSSVICFIDALDECEESQIRDMISFFELIGKLAVSKGIKFHTCFSSRHYPHITIKQGLNLVLEGQEGHTQDIIKYLDSELKIGQDAAVQQIRSELQQKSSGIFMWVILVVGILNREYDEGRLRDPQGRIKEIPKNLHELFRDILMRDLRHQDELLLCIQWVLFSLKPLTPEQLYSAILSGTEPKALKSWGSNKVSLDVIKRFLLSSSKGLIEITKSKNPRVQFIHESVNDFLIKENGLATISPTLGSNVEGPSHERLKKCCLRYIKMKSLNSLVIPECLPKASSQEAETLRRSTSNAFPFLEYAVHNVLYHADLAARYGTAQERLVSKFPLARWVRFDALFQKHQIRRYTDGVSLLYLMAERNLYTLVRTCPSVLPWFEPIQERYGPPLFAALATGSGESAQIIWQAITEQQIPGSRLHQLCGQYYRDGELPLKLDRGFKFSSRNILRYIARLGNEVMFALVLETGKAMNDSRDARGRTPLSHAAEGGHEAIVKLLLNTGKVKIDSKDTEHRTPLSYAAGSGHESILKLLLGTRKVKIDSKDFRGRAPLSYAAEGGYESIIKLLLDTGKVEIDSKGASGRTPLFWAAESGNEAIVKLLLVTGQVEIDSRDRSGQTPLSQAAAKGHETVLKLLLNTSMANADLKDTCGRTPLSHAAENGNAATLQHLLKTGKVEVDSKDHDDRTPLSWAAEMGNEAAVKLLLNTGQADIESKDKYGRTPLSRAAKKGSTTTVKLLLDIGKAEIDSRDKNGRSPLSLAAENACDTTVRLLLDTGMVKTDSKDNNGRTALSWVVTGKFWNRDRECKAIIKLLLGSGRAEIDSKDADGRTPLSWAAGSGNGGMAKLLLDTGKVDVNSKDSSGRTPLSWAANNWDEGMAKLLLDTGKVDVNSKDSSGRTPLSWAAESGNGDTVKLFLNTGEVEVDCKDKDGRTPLSRAAAAWGSERHIRLLLETGKAEIDSKDKDGRTPLSLAAERGRELAIKLLLDIGKAKIDSRDEEGKTPLTWAVASNQTFVVRLLKSHGASFA